jgi:hypothetical protein
MPDYQIYSYHILKTLVAYLFRNLVLVEIRIYCIVAMMNRRGETIILSIINFIIDDSVIIMAKVLNPSNHPIQLILENIFELR